MKLVWYEGNLFVFEITILGTGMGWDGMNNQTTTCITFSFEVKAMNSQRDEIFERNLKLQINYRWWSFFLYSIERAAASCV